MKNRRLQGRRVEPPAVLLKARIGLRVRTHAKQGRAVLSKQLNNHAYNAPYGLACGCSAPIEAATQELQSVRAGPGTLRAFRRAWRRSGGARLKRREEAERLVTCLLDEIAGALERGLRVELRGLGALTVKPKRERQGRNPRTGEALTIEARRVVRFRVSELLLARLNRLTNQRPERPKVDPRQLALPMEDPHDERADSGAVIASPPTAGRRKAARKT